MSADARVVDWYCEDDDCGFCQGAETD